MCHHGCVGIKVIFAAHHLAGLRRIQTQLAGHLIDAVRIAKLRFGEPQLAVLFLEQSALLLLGLDPVSIFNGAEVLQP